MERRSNRRLQQNGNQPESPERAALEALVEAVVGAAYEVSNVLGAGFLEKLYERALIEELRLRGIPTAAQATFPVAYKGRHLSDDTSWESAVAGDFAEFRKAGLTHAMMADIENELGISR